MIEERTYTLMMCLKKYETAQIRTIASLIKQRRGGYEHKSTDRNNGIDDNLKKR